MTAFLVYSEAILRYKSFGMSRMNQQNDNATSYSYFSHFLVLFLMIDFLVHSEAPFLVHSKVRVTLNVENELPNTTSLFTHIFHIYQLFFFSWQLTQVILRHLMALSWVL